VLVVRTVVRVIEPGTYDVQMVKVRRAIGQRSL